MKTGSEFNHSFRITAELVNNFQRLFNEANPIHHSRAYALEKGFTGRVVYGNVLNAYLSYFIGDILPVKNVIILSQEIRYSAPLYLDDAIIFKATLKDIYNGGRTLEFGFDFSREKTQVARGKFMLNII